MEPITKPFWQSKTLWGAVITLTGALLFMVFGTGATPAEQEGATNAVMMVIAGITELIGIVTVIVGRVKAKKDLSG